MATLCHQEEAELSILLQFTSGTSHFASPLPPAEAALRSTAPAIAGSSSDSAAPAAAPRAPSLRPSPSSRPAAGPTHRSRHPRGLRSRAQGRSHTADTAACNPARPAYCQFACARANFCQRRQQRSHYSHGGASGQPDRYQRRAGQRLCARCVGGVGTVCQRCPPAGCERLCGGSKPA